MSFEVHALPILEDNFVYVGVREKHAFAVDPGEPTALLKFLEKNDLHLEAILITHEHADHIGGLLEVCEYTQAPVYFSVHCKKVPEILKAAGYHQDKIFALGTKRHFEVLGCKVMVLSGVGHTSEQILFHFPIQHKIFTGDLLFHLGCGRIFDGTMAQHFESVQSLKTLAYATQLYPTHDYSDANLAFCTANDLIVGKSYPLLHQIPIELRIELEWNPFLKAKSLEHFTELRQSRNNFKHIK